MNSDIAPTVDVLWKTKMVEIMSKNKYGGINDMESRWTKIPQDFSCPFVECAQSPYYYNKMCDRWRAWFSRSWASIHKQGLEAIERRKLNEYPTV